MISHPKRKCHLPTIHFQVRTVTFREGIHFLWFFKHPWNRTCKFRIWPEVPGTVATKRHWGSWAVLLGTPGEMVFVRFHGSKSVGLLNTHCGLERHFTKILLPKKQVKSRDFFWWKKMRVFVADPSSSFYIWKQASQLAIFRVTMEPWFQICSELENERRGLGRHTTLRKSTASRAI